jgi:hypothetical protein
MPNKQVRVESGLNGPVRIFRDKQWLDFPPELVQIMDRAVAVKNIRLQVFERAFNVDIWNAECERCGRGITWDTMEMHEQVPKGKGGEVALNNCEALCINCHTAGPDAAHADRRWQTQKLDPEGS